jgi:hypothetical protein
MLRRVALVRTDVSGERDKNRWTRNNVSQTNPVHTTPFYFPKIYLNIFHPIKLNFLVTTHFDLPTNILHALLSLALIFTLYRITTNELHGF